MTARRWISVLGAALVVSLALNLFFGGVIAGHRLGQRGDAGWQQLPARLKIERVLSALPENDAQVMRGLFEAQRADIIQRFQALQESRRAIGAALKAAPFDPAAFTAAYDAMQARAQELQAAIHGVIKAAIPQLSPEGRAVVAERRWRK
jgi:Spy/CpxP family protein refolding chaperone